MQFDKDLNINAISVGKLRRILGDLNPDIVVTPNERGDLAMFYEDRFAGWISLFDETVVWVNKAIPPVVLTKEMRAK